MNVKFQDIMSSLRVIKATIEGMGEKRNAWRVFVRKPGKDRPLRPRRTWDGNIKMDHIETGCEGVE
jgi:hypothetical protein